MLDQIERVKTTSILSTVAWATAHIRRLADWQGTAYNGVASRKCTVCHRGNVHMASATLDLPTISTLPVSEADAQRAAGAYVTTHLDPVFEVVEGTRYYHKGR